MRRILVACSLFLVAAGLGAFLRFEGTPPARTCALCHEIRPSRDSWMRGAHAGVSCKACHGRSCESPVALFENASRVWKHLTKTSHAEFGATYPLDEGQVERMSAKCANCHQAEAAQWMRSGHARPVETFLTNALHNAAWKPSDNCLRCHGMFLQGDASTILARTGLSTTWRMADPGQGRRAAVPCLACHSMHGPTNGASALAFYSRPEKRAYPLSALYRATIVDEKGRTVRTSDDPRQVLCMQCHAANAEGHAGSCDDRTPRGAQEGMSCLDCHSPHGGRPRAARGRCPAKN
ncbi:MAG: multiheme c-type cytochrome [Kiritimatiellia bacterium]